MRPPVYTPADRARIVAHAKENREAGLHLMHGIKVMESTLRDWMRVAELADEHRHQPPYRPPSR